LTLGHGDLDNDDLPAFFRAADRQAIRWRRQTQVVHSTQIAALVLVAIGGATSAHLGQHEASAWLSVVAVLASLRLRLYQSQRNPQGRWYRARAAAESSKTLGWKYAVGADPFPEDLDPVAALELFVEQLDEVAKTLPDLEEGAADGAQVSDAMRELRAAPLEDRVTAYLAGRIEEQRDWYAGRADLNRKRSRLWAIGTAGIEIAALVAAIVRLTSAIEFDWLGILSTAAAGAVGWLQSQRHDELTQAYSQTSQELASIATTLSPAPTSDPDWARRADEAEDAISREHKLWLASRSRVP
jgi:hypothetical protein